MPGEVDDDLWSEHFARYAFARRFCTGKRVLDAGCGTGYGAAELALDAAYVAALDIAPDAVRYASGLYQGSNAGFAVSSCEALPVKSASLDVVVAFEVVEHLEDSRSFLAESARVLRGDGLLIISTPNKSYYAESRASTGPNPYHRREFEPEEFCAALGAVFEHVVLLVQNRVAAFAFYALKRFWPLDARMDGMAGSEKDAHFLIALCSRTRLPALRSFAYIPRAANLMREREEHIRLLSEELRQTNRWLAEAQRERNELLGLFRKQKEELEERNRWASQLDRQLEASQARVVQAQDELAAEQAAARAVAAGYENKVAELEADNLAKTNWALETERRLTAELEHHTAQLTECLRLLQDAEATVAERTRWAQEAEAKRVELEALVNHIRSSRWLKAGRRLGLGPVLQEP